MATTRKPAKRKRARYVLRWWEGETRKQQSFDRAQDRDDFQLALRRMQQTRGVIDIGSDVTLDVYIEEYWRLHAVPNLEPQTRRNYAQQWAKWIAPRLGSYKLRAISAQVIHRQLVTEMRRADAGDPTIRNVLVVLQSVLRLAHTEGRVFENAAALVRKPPQRVAREVAPIEPLMVERLRNRFGVRDATMVSLLAYRGLRPQELLALHVEDLVPDGVRIHRKNVDGVIYPYTKTRRSRTPPLLAAVREDVAQYMLATGIRSGLLFPNTAGRAWSAGDYGHWRTRVFKPHAEIVGLPSAVPYDLRGSSVSLEVWEGVTMLEVARRHGHSVAVCDDHYAGIFDGFDPSKRTSAEAAVRAARKKASGALALFEIGSES